MSMLNYHKLPALLGLGLLMSLSAPAQAQWPTLDIAAIKEGIQSKIELVKQSKIVTQATEQAGKLNSAIGDAKSSMTKFAGDNIEKAKKKAEKLKKEKERLEEKKEKLDKAKEKAEKAKQKAEKAQKLMNDAQKLKNDSLKKVNDVGSMINDAKQMAADVKSTAQGAIATAQSTVNDAKQMANDARATAKGAISDARSTVNEARETAIGTVGDMRAQVNDARGMVAGAIPAEMQQQYVISDDSFVDDYVADYEAGINSDSKIYEEIPETYGSFNPASEISLNNATIEKLQALQLSGDEIQNIAEQPLSAGMIEKLQMRGADTETINAISAQKGLISGGDIDSNAELPQLKKLEKITPATINEKSLNRQAFGRDKITAAQSKLGDLKASIAQSQEAVAAANAKVQTGVNSASEIKSKLGALKADMAQNQPVTTSVAAQLQSGSGSTSPVQSKLGELKASIAQSQEAVAAANAKVQTGVNSASEIKSKLGALKADIAQNQPAAANSLASTEAKKAAKINAKEISQGVSAVKKSSERLKSGFRQPAVIKNEIRALDKGAWLLPDETVKTASYSHSETLMFGAESGSSDIPDGVIFNGDYDETVMPETMVDYCKFGVDKLNDVTMIQNCMKELIKHMSDKDSQVAMEGKAIHTKMMSQVVIAAVAESMALKNTAANYGEKLDKQEEDMGSASTTRDDTGALAMTNKETQYVINKLLSSQTTLGILEALKLVGGFDYADLGEDEGDE